MHRCTFVNELRVSISDDRLARRGAALMTACRYAVSFLGDCSDGWMMEERKEETPVQARPHGAALRFPSVEAHTNQ